MSNTVLEDLLHHVRPECGACPLEQMLQSFVAAIRDFCDVTRVYQSEVEAETIVATVPDYEISLPSNEVEPIAIEYLSVDGAESKFKDTRWLDRYCTNWRLRNADDFRFFTQLRPGVITFPGRPTRNGTAGGMYYRVSLRPTLTAQNVDAALANEWLQAWADATKARLLAMAGKSWSNPKRAEQLELSYRSQRGAARIRAINSYGNAEQRWSNPRGFA